MKLSLNWLADHVDLADIPIKQLAHELTMSVVEVEDVLDLPATLDGMAIGEDRLLEIDNKSLTNRPDLWCHYGIARELAAIYKRPLRPLPEAPDLPRLTGLIGKVDPAVCGRFAALRIANATALEAPEFIRSRLARIGQRSINFYADLTNYVMLEVGQPSHAYAAERLEGPLSVRRARDGETLELLDGQVATLSPIVPVIADDARAVGLAGIMGGLPSSVERGTAEVVIEIAAFGAQAVRRSAAEVNLRTDASSRFEKAIDTQRVDLAIAMLAQLIRDHDPQATILGLEDLTLKPTETNLIALDQEFLAARLGERLAEAEVLNLLARLGFEAAAVDGGVIQVRTPSWRSTGDVGVPEDLVEEVARLYGYDRFSFVAPQVEMRAPVRPVRLDVERRCKEVLATAAGAQEIVTYPWLAPSELAAIGAGEDGLLKLLVAAGPDQTLLRPSLVPGLLRCIAANHDSPELSVFETGRVFAAGGWATLTSDREKLPRQPKHLAAAIAGGADAQSLFRRALGNFEALGRLAHLEDVRVGDAADAAWAEPGAQRAILAGGVEIGVIGLLSRRAKRLAKIRHAHVALFEIDLDRIRPLPSRDNRFTALPEQPSNPQDLSFLFPFETGWASIAALARGADPLIEAVEFIDEYVGKGIPAGAKSITLRLTLRADDRSVSSAEAASVVANVSGLMTRQLGGERRG